MQTAPGIDQQASNASGRATDQGLVVGGDSMGGVVSEQSGMSQGYTAFKVHGGESDSSERLFQGLWKLAESSVKVLKKMLDKQRGTARRSFKGSPRRKTIESTGYGRNTHLTQFKQCDSAVALLATIFKALKSGHFNPLKQSGSIRVDDLLGWRKTTRESFNLVLVADSSKSTNRFLGKFADIIIRLAGYFKRNRDRMGLIVVQGKQARVLHNPTNNYQVVTRGIKSISIGGETPLASGLQRSMDMITLEKFRKPGAKNLVILVSDCAPEPLSGKYADVLDEPSYQACITAAKSMKRKQIPLIIINPSFWSKDEHYPHERLTNLLVQASGAKLIKFSGDADEHRTFSDSEVSRIFSGIERFFPLS